MSDNNEKATTTRSFSETHTNQNETVYHRGDSIKAIALIGIFGTFGAVLYYLWLYFQTGGWQMLVAVAGVVVAALALGGTLWLNRREKHNMAKYFVIAAVVLGYGVPASVYDGAGLYFGIGGGLLIVLVGSVLMPSEWLRWGSAALLFGIYVSLVGLFEPLPRYDTTQLSSLNIFLLSITILMGLIVVWHVISSFSVGTIRARLLVVFVSIVFLAVVVTALVSAVSSFRSGRQQAIEQLESVATLKESEIDTWVQDLKLEIDALTSGEDAVMQRSILSPASRYAEMSSAARDTLLAHFRSRVERTRRFEELFLMDTEGKVLVSTNSFQENRIFNELNYFQQGLQGLYVSPPFLSPSLRRVTIVISYPVLDAEGNVLGVLAGRSSLRALNDIMLERAGLGATGETYLVGADYASVTDIRYKAQDIIQTEGAERVLAEQVDGYGLYENYASIPVIGVYHWIPSIQVGLLAEQAQSEAFRPIYLTLIISAGVAIAAVLLAAIAATVFVTTSVSNPLERLVEATTHIAAGDLERTAEVEREDEVGALAAAFNSMTQQLRDLVGSLEQRVQARTNELERRAAQLQAVAEVSRVASSLLDIDELLNTVVDLARERLDLYYVGIFLVDEAREYAWLRAGTGDAGREMLARKHKLAIGETSMIGWCVKQGEARIALDVGKDAVHFSNPLLPQTRSELALPLRVRGEVIGAMTVQSVEPKAFSEEDILVLQTMADQVANAIANAQLYQESQERLEEVSRLQRQYLREVWTEEIEQRPEVTFEYTLPDVEVLQRDTLPLEERALADNRLVLAEETTEGNIKMTTAVKPIALRGQVIGTLGAQAGVAEQQLDAEKKEELTAVLEAVGEQMALALENVRLIEESHNRAVREQRLREVSAKMRDATSMDAIIQVALQEFNKQLNPAQAFVHIELPSTVTEADS